MKHNQYYQLAVFLFTLIFSACTQEVGQSASETVKVETSDVYWSHVYWNSVSDECKSQPELAECRVEPIVRYPNRVLKGFVDVSPEVDLINDMSVAKITLHSFSYEVNGDNCVIEGKVTDPETMEFEDRTSQQLTMTLTFKSECHASSLIVKAKKKIEYNTGKIDDSSTQILEFDVAESDGSPQVDPYDDDEKYDNIDTLALSISYVDTSYLNGKYTDRFRIKASNKKYDGSAVGFGVVSGLKRVSSTLDSSYYGHDYGVMYAYDNYNPGSETGIIFQGEDRAFFQNGVFPFFRGGGDSRNVRPGDTVVILPNSSGSRTDSHYLGGWVVDDFIWGDGEIDGNYTIPLKWNFSPSANEPATRIEQLAFAIGTNERVNECTHDTTAVVAKAFNGDNVLTNGTIYVDVEYEPYMVGKDIFVYANYRPQERIVDGRIIKKHTGDAIRYTLKGKGINEWAGLSFTNEDAENTQTVSASYVLRLDDLIYTEEDKTTGTQEDVDEYAQGVTMAFLYDVEGTGSVTVGRTDCFGVSVIEAILPPGGGITFTLKGNDFAREYQYSENQP
jgi:hypothetical protein